MNLGILHITATKKPPCRTKVSVRSTTRLADLGFVYDSPVYAIPQPEGFTLALQNEHHEKDSGKLIHVVNRLH